MYIDEDHLRLTTQWMCTQYGIDRRKGIVEGALHKHLSQNLKHKDLAAPGVSEQPMSPSGGLLGEIQRTQDARFVFDVGQHILLIEGVIAQRQTVDAGFQKRVGMRAG
jgi:hypothetical protein